MLVRVVKLSVFDAYVHSTPVVLVLVLCTVVYNLLVPQVCALCHVRACSQYCKCEAFVLSTHFSLVVLACVVVRHPVVPPVVHVVKSCACC